MITEDKELHEALKHLVGKVLAKILAKCRRNELNIRQFLRRSAFTIKISTSITRRENWSERKSLSSSDHMRSWYVENVSLFSSKLFDLKF